MTPSTCGVARFTLPAQGAALGTPWAAATAPSPLTCVDDASGLRRGEAFLDGPRARLLLAAGEVGQQAQLLVGGPAAAMAG